MKKLVYGFALLLVAASIGIVLVKHVWHVAAFKDLGLEVPVLMLTLAPLVIYMYDTHRIANWTCAPSARFDIEQPDPTQHPLLLNSFPVNLCDFPLKLYCRAVAQVDGVEVKLRRFYGEQFPWHLGPRGRYKGVIHLEDVFKEAGTCVSELAAKARELGRGEAANSLVLLTYSYRYMTMDGKYKSEWFYQGHYYDLFEGRLVLDVHPRHQPYSGA
jgi:hypothetical protein